MGKVIAVANQKGGVGKTTTTVNLSACLGALQKKVLLCDLDPQGNATSGVGISKREIGKSIYDVMIGSCETQEAVLTTKYRNLSILPCTINLAGAEVEMVGIEGREYLLKNALDGLREEYDFILIDCPPSLGLLTINALSACDTVLVPIQCEYYALEGLSQLMATIRSVKQRMNPGLDIEGVLLTMFDGRTNLSMQVVEEVKKFMPSKVYKSIIPRNVRLSEAPSFGQPIIEYDRTSRGAQCYMELADEVIRGQKER